jgi:hypothetical protein
MLTFNNADVAGAGAPEYSTNDKARVQAGQVEEQSREQSHHCRARGVAHQARQVVAEAARNQSGKGANPAGVSSGNIATGEARCLSITRALRRIGHALIARDDGIWIVRSWGGARAHGPTPATANASEWQSAREHPR